MVKMSIVLPRRKKHVDIFAPSKAIQDAKAKIGPAFFDVTLMECSRNAVELTKLVHQWENLDRAKLKILKDISHEQEILLRSLKKNKVQTRKDKTNTVTDSEKTPGFRFKSNGDIKKSSKSTPILHYADTQDGDTDTDEDEYHRTTSSFKGKSRSKSAEVKSRDYERVNYDNEIHELETVIRDIYLDLIKNNVSLSSNVSGHSVKTFLRAHSHEYVPLPDLSDIDLTDITQPNDRFAFKPGTSNKRDKYLHRSASKSPSHRSCHGCQTRQRQDHTDLAKISTHAEDHSKRRWCYVPHGKYVQSTYTLHGTTSITERKSASSLTSKTSKTTTKPAKSIVQFVTENTNIPPRRAVSISATPKSDATSSRADITGARPKSCVSLNPGKSAVDSVADLSVSKSINVLGWKSALDGEDRASSPSISCKLARASSAKINAHFVDHESRLNLLKSKEIEEGKQCEKKISDFLLKISSSK